MPDVLLTSALHCACACWNVCDGIQFARKKRADSDEDEEYDL